MIYSTFLKTLWQPLTVVALIILYFILLAVAIPVIILNTILLIAIIIGCFDLFLENIKLAAKGRFFLDYIAVLSIVFGIITNEYLVAAVIALMLSGGNALEHYAEKKAKRQLQNLIKRIPEKVTVVNDEILQEVDLKTIKQGDIILIRKGEVAPVDGKILEDAAAFDESAVTGESEEIIKYKGDKVISGTLNVGDVVKMIVSKSFEESSYSQIIKLVEDAQSKKSGFIRLAEKYNIVFTIFTLVIAILAYLMSGYSLERVLAVLVVATPCPLILATPVALIGGVNSASRKNIIFKQIAALEKLNLINIIAFDKTGTLTLDTPILYEIKNFSSKTETEILAIAASIERNSLHPVAKAIIKKAKDLNINFNLKIDDIIEEVGIGIKAEIDNIEYLVQKSQKESAVDLLEKENLIATFYFREEAKQDTRNVLKNLKLSGLDLYILTGDKKEKADKLQEYLDLKINILSELSPVDKENVIFDLTKNGKKVGMVGDGINDAASLAASYVGMAFVHDEQSAASEAADIIFLNSKIDSVYAAFYISKKTIEIAQQSIFIGIGLSALFMIIASIGLLTPIAGATIQEIIDVAVILNALRASRMNVN